METGFTWFLFSIVMAIIFFILQKTVKTLSYKYIIIGYAAAAYLFILGILAFFHQLDTLYVVFSGLVIILVVIIMLDRPIIRGKKVNGRVNSWLEQVLKDDLNKCASRIFWREYIWQFQGFTNTDPYFDMIVTLINTNIFPVKVNGIEGRFLIEGHECAHPAELLSAISIPHGEAQNIAIRQRISGEMKKFIIKHNYSEETLKITVTSCRILLQPWIQGKQPVWVSVGGEFTIPIRQLLASCTSNPWLL